MPITQPTDGLSMRRWGIRSGINRRFYNKRMPVQSINNKYDERDEKLKYMESYLARDKKYIPYENKDEVARRMRAIHQKNNERAEFWKPIMIVVLLVAIAIYGMYQLGWFSP